jgi:hypothetical protein
VPAAGASSNWRRPSRANHAIAIGASGLLASFRSAGAQTLNLLGMHAPARQIVAIDSQDDHTRARLDVLARHEHATAARTPPIVAAMARAPSTRDAVDPAAVWRSTPRRPRSTGFASSRTRRGIEPTEQGRRHARVNLDSLLAALGLSVCAPAGAAGRARPTATVGRGIIARQCLARGMTAASGVAM